MRLSKIVVILLLLVTVLGLGYWFFKKNKMLNQDLRMAYFDDSGIVIKSISRQRRMVNIARVSGDVSVWIPGGLGWYEAGKIKKLLEQEKQQYKASEILFFNFGFNPNMVRFSAENSHQDWWNVGGGLMTKEEKITGPLNSEKEFLTTIMQRDFADSQVVEEGIRASVYNLGVANGLGGVVARNLEWMGVTVVGVESLSREEVTEKCQVVFGDKVAMTKTGGLLRVLFSQCKQNVDSLLGEKDVELYLTDKYAEMINYQSYNNSN